MNVSSTSLTRASFWPGVGLRDGGPASVWAWRVFQAVEYGEEWVSHTREDEAFEFSISSNVASGVIVLAAKAALSSLDAVAFDQWLSAFVERLDVTSGVFPKESLGLQRPGDARAPGSARTAL